MINNHQIEPHQVIVEFCMQNYGFIMMNIMLKTLSSIFHILIPLSLGWFYEIVFLKGGTKLYILDQLLKNPFSLEVFFIVFVTFLICYTLCFYFSEYFARKLNEKFTFTVRNRLVEAQMNHTIAANRQKSYGKYLLRFSGDLSTVQNIPRFAIVNPVSDVIFVIFLFGLALSLSVTLLLFELFICLMFFLSLLLLNSRIKTITQARRDQLSINLNWITNRLANFDTVQLFNRSRLENKRFIKKSMRLYERGLAYAGSISLMKTLPKLFFNLQLVGLLLLISYMNRDQQVIESRNAIAFILIAFYTRSPLNRIYMLKAKWKIAIVSLYKIVGIINQPKEAYVLSPFRLNDSVIEFKNLSFDYPLTNVFQNLNLVINPKSITLISGAFLTGKTTLVKLLTQQLNPNLGYILIDGKDLSSLPVATWRKQFTLIADGYDFIGTTLFEALSYSMTSKKQMQAIELINRFELDQKQSCQDLLDLKLEQFNSQSSNQEKILFKFIRSFLSDKPLVIIDDLIHQLDPKNQEKIGQFLQELKSKKTIIITSNQEIKSLHHDHQYTLPPISSH
jgi:ABC-type multidrug transport system fused ATPase/permease subunit